jgi:hypothetical protein
LTKLTLPSVGGQGKRLHSRELIAKNPEEVGMKIQKTISEKVFAANRWNAQKSTGAKTATGKKNSRGNALKNGLFASELYVAEGEEQELQTLRREIGSELVPETALQKLAVDEIVACSWKMKLAAHLETRHLRAHLGEIAKQDGQNEVSGEEALMSGWYRSSRLNLRAGIRFLARLRDDVGTHGRIREFFTEELVRGFGTDFYDLLNSWLPVNVDVIGFTDQMLHHRDNYKIPLPDEIPRVVVDIRAHLQMVIKLIEQQARHLEDLDQTFEHRSATSRAGPTDFAPRYFSSASRDLHRAIDWFVHLKHQRM